MNFFRIDLKENVKVAVIGKEHLVPPTLHCQRKIKCYVLYFVTSGEEKIFSYLILETRHTR